MAAGFPRDACLDHDAYPIFPSIESLLRELGEDFVSLHRDGPTWHALGKIMSPSEDGTGLTPEEALANLYISLHGHNR